MIYSTYRFTLDLQKHQSQQSIAVFQGDTAVRLYISLTDGGKPFVLPEGSFAVFSGKCANNEPLLHSCTICNNNTEIMYEFQGSTSAVVGVVNCQCRLYGSNQRLITAPRFSIVVEERIVNDDLEIEIPEGQLTALDDILLNETARYNAEIARGNAEALRADNENAREDNEETRKQNEINRQAAYEKRVAAFEGTAASLRDTFNQTTATLTKSFEGTVTTLEKNADDRLQGLEDYNAEVLGKISKVGEEVQENAKKVEDALAESWTFVEVEAKSNKYNLEKNQTYLIKNNDPGSSWSPKVVAEWSDMVIINSADLSNFSFDKWTDHVKFKICGYEYKIALGSANKIQFVYEINGTRYTESFDTTANGNNDVSIYIKKETTPDISVFKIREDAQIKGIKGDPGKSAYEVAKDEGFPGTEAEWLESLEGNDGESAYDVAVRNGFKGTEKEWLEFIKGEKGDPGEGMPGVSSLTGKRDVFTTEFTSGSSIWIDGNNIVSYGRESTAYGYYTPIVEGLNTEHKYFLYINFEKCINYTLTAGKIEIKNKYAGIQTITSIYQPTNNELAAVFAPRADTITGLNLWLGSMSTENTILNYYCLIDLTANGWNNLIAEEVYEKLTADELLLLGKGEKVTFQLAAKMISYDNTKGLSAQDVQGAIEEAVELSSKISIGAIDLLFGSPMYSKGGLNFNYEANRGWQDVDVSEIEGIVGGGIYSFVYTNVRGLDITQGCFVVRYYDASDAQLVARPYYANGSGIIYLYPPKNTVKIKLILRLVAEVHMPEKGIVEVGSISLYQGKASYNKIINDELPMPSYYLAHLIEKEATILQKGELSALNGDSFVFFSDYHVEGNVENSPALIKHVIDNTNTRFVAYGGDVINNGYDDNGNNTVANVRKRFLDFKEKFRFLPTYKFRKVIGNHEWNNPGVAENHIPELTPEQVHLYYHKEDEEFNVFSPNRMSFYFDNTTQKIRYFGMGCLKNAAIPTESIEWLYEQFEDVPSDYSVVIFGHNMLNHDGTKIGKEDLAYGIDKLKTGGNYTFNGKTYNFTAHDVIGVFSGDIHLDAFVYTNGGIPFIATTCDCYSREVGGLDRTVGTINEQAFDVVNIDRTNRKIYMTRIGAGVDREISF